MRHAKTTALLVFVMMMVQQAFSQDNKAVPGIHLMELRNYVLKPGARNRFIDYFEKNFVTSQIDAGAYPVARFRIKGEPDHFLWMRAFADMASRSKFLPSFYYGPVWKEYGKEANNMLVNNDNVYLLKPLTYHNGKLDSAAAIDLLKLKSIKGIAVINFFIANTKLEKLKAAFANYYLHACENAGIINYTLWVSEMSKNDFPRLPVFQDANLMVMISYYADEQVYQLKQGQVEAALTAEEKADLADIITLKNTMIVHPTQQSVK